jgi:NTP pyrophosphatase (non-canonical NTP hydrolase)
MSGTTSPLDSVSRLHPPEILGLKEAQKSFASYQDAAFPLRGAAFFALELAGECGELCNLEKKIWRNPKSPFDAAHLAEEAADVLITLMNYANARGLDLDEAVRLKLERIEERRRQGLMGERKNL